MEKESSAANFWLDQKAASQAMQELESLKGEVLAFKETENEVTELLDLSQLISEKSRDYEKEKSEIEGKVSELEKRVSQVEFHILFSEKYDRNDAIISIYSGAGGVDAQDWAEMLLRMYLRFAEKKGLRVRILDETRGQEGGIKNATLEVVGPYSYGNLKGESGVHRLVRLSPYNAKSLRQTSFAMAEVLPVIAETGEVAIDPKDLRIDVYRSSGPGGQGVNTTDSAVRITHVPTGIVAACQNERSQLQNREQALKILKAKLHKKYSEEREREKLELKGEPVSAEWGSQIRSYVVHPYKLVKDHRTKFETTDVESVFAGNLENFIEAYLKSLKK